jgi:hypothetical protein
MSNQLLVDQQKGCDRVHLLIHRERRLSGKGHHIPHNLLQYPGLTKGCIKISQNRQKSDDAGSIPDMADLFCYNKIHF